MIEKYHSHKEALEVVRDAASGVLAETKKLPCRVDEMTEREHAIFHLCAALNGTMHFILDFTKDQLDYVEREGVSPCRICGKLGQTVDDEDGSAVSCLDCGISVQSSTIDCAVEKWNRLMGAIP